MELRVLQYFLTVAREQSISGAARALHLSQPTLSTQLRDLEASLGKQLLVRGVKGSRRVTLTDEGMLLRKRAEEILSLVQKTENEIARSADAVAGDVYIGAGETDSVRYLARAARSLQQKYPDIHYHISSGNASFVVDQLDKGLVDFGILFGMVDPVKYDMLQIPVKDVWGVIMRSDAPLAEKPYVEPKDLQDKPLILSEQENQKGELAAWFGCDSDSLHVVATYNLLFNGALFVDEGLGYAISLDKLIDVRHNQSLCFRPLLPRLEATAYLVWKKYQVFSKAAAVFLDCLQQTWAQT